MAREAMSVVRTDVKELIGRWRSAGYRFGYDFAGGWVGDEVASAPPLIGAPTDQQLAALDRFEASAGALPVVLRAFYEVVGAINLVGEPPAGWPALEELDALQIAGFSEEPLETDDGFELHICPDHLHKVFISGVGSLATPVPDSGFDAALYFEGEPLVLDGVKLTLGHYLRLCLLEGAGAGVAGSGPTVEMRELASELRPF